MRFSLEMFRVLYRLLKLTFHDIRCNPDAATTHFWTLLNTFEHNMGPSRLRPTLAASLLNTLVSKILRISQQMHPWKQLKPNRLEKTNCKNRTNMLHFGLKHMDTVSCPGLTIRLPLHLPPVGAVIIAQPEGIVSAFGAHNHLATKGCHGVAKYPRCWQRCRIGKMIIVYTMSDMTRPWATRTTI